MARNKKVMLDDLTGWAYDQVKRKLDAQRSGGVSPSASTQAPVSPPEGKKVAVRVNKRAPNKTELEYNRRYLGGAGKFEAISLRLPGGSQYKPDWFCVGENGRPTLHEVKGSYKFHSQGSAAMRFRECVSAFPEFDFVWAVRNEDGSWNIQQGRENNAVS